MTIPPKDSRHDKLEAAMWYSREAALTAFLNAEEKLRVPKQQIVYPFRGMTDKPTPIDAPIRVSHMEQADERSMIHIWAMIKGWFPKLTMVLEDDSNILVQLSATTQIRFEMDDSGVTCKLRAHRDTLGGMYFDEMDGHKYVTINEDTYTIKRDEHYPVLDQCRWIILMCGISATIVRNQVLALSLIVNPGADTIREGVVLLGLADQAAPSEPQVHDKPLMDLLP